MPELISRKVLFSDPERTLVKISPQGEKLAFLAPFKNNLNVWVGSIDAPSQAKLITQSIHSIRDYWWVSDDLLLFIHDHNGDENWQLHGYQFSTGKIKTYTPLKTRARLLQIGKESTNTVLIALNKRDPHYHDVYKLNVVTGELDCIYQNRLYWDFIADEHLNLKVALKVEGEEGIYFKLSEQGEDVYLTHVTSHDLFSYYFYATLRLGLDKQGQTLFLTKTVENTAGLVAIALAEGKAELLGSNEMADVCDVFLDPLERKPLAFATNYQRKKWEALTLEVKKDFDFLAQLDKGDISITSQTANNKEWIVAFLHDDAPVTFYHYHRDHQKATYLFDSHNAIKSYALVKMQPHVITMRDGLQCVSFLSLPKQKTPAPLVLLVHGGPNYRDQWGFSPTHQWLANRGYAVLSVNYRASTGYGKAHSEAGNREWAGKIQEDLLDAVQWAIQAGITTSDKVAIMGRSFGGYATLVGLTMTPDFFCCGVDIVGLANLETVFKHSPPYWKSMEKAIHKIVGCDPNTAEGKEYLAKRSPLSYADQIKKPLLIAHGACDVQVMQSESDKMAEVMRANHIPFTYVVFPDEGHQFLRPGNRMAFYALAEAFLAKNLGGKVEPSEPDVQTSMIVKQDDFRLA